MKKIKIKLCLWWMGGILLAAAIIPATAMLITSCSNTATNVDTGPDISKSNSTVFLENTNVALPQTLKKLSSAEVVQNDFAATNKDLQDYLFSNLITGNKTDLLATDIKLISSGTTINASAGTIKLSYSIPFTWSENKKVEEVYKASANLNGFSIKTTTFNSPGTFVAPPDFRDFSPSQIIAGNGEAKLKDFLFSNYVSGHKENMSSNNIMLIFNTNTSNDNTGVLNLEWQVNNYWENGLQQNSSKSYPVEITGCRKTKTTNFINTINISEFENTYLNKWASEFLTQVTNNSSFREQIISKIYTSIITGDKDGISASDVSIAINKSKADDWSREVTLVYSVANALVDSQPITLERTLTITNLGLRTKPTQLNNYSTVNSAYSVEPYTSLSYVDINNLWNSAGDFGQEIFNSVIEGNKEGLTLSDIKINGLDNVAGYQNTIEISVSITKYWGERGLIEQPTDFVVYMDGVGSSRV